MNQLDAFNVLIIDWVRTLLRSAWVLTLTLRGWVQENRQEFPIFEGMRIYLPVLFFTILITSCNPTPNVKINNGTEDLIIQSSQSMLDTTRGFLADDTILTFPPLSPYWEFLKDGVIIKVSCDTRNSKTMKRVLDEGVEIINDVSGLNYDKSTINIIKEYSWRNIKVKEKW